MSLEKQDTDIVVNVPAFLLAGMDKEDGLSKAKVLHHTGNELQIEVGGVQTTLKTSSKDKSTFKTNTVLLFNDNGSIAGYAKGKGGVAVAKEKSETSRSTARSGSTNYRKEQLL